MTTGGKLTKLKIEAYEDDKYQKATGKVFTTAINPSKLQEKFSIDYSKKQGKGVSSEPLKFSKIKSPEFKLDLLFDGTGVLADKRSVDDQIKGFKEVVLKLDGKIHQPYYVKIIWGSFLFTGRLTDLDLEYTLFNPDGKPLRAKGKCVFREGINKEVRAAKEKKSSPDLTHERLVKSGDTLVKMCYDIYGDSRHYLEVARVNGLINFRTLEVGTTLYFPPIDKTVKSA